MECLKSLEIADKNRQPTIHATIAVPSLQGLTCSGSVRTRRYQNPLVQPHVYASILLPKNGDVSIKPPPLITWTSFRSQPWWIIGHLVLVFGLLLVPVTCKAANGPHSLFMTMSMVQDQPALSSHAHRHPEGMARMTARTSEPAESQPHQLDRTRPSLQTMPEPESLSASADAMVAPFPSIDLPRHAVTTANPTIAYVSRPTLLDPPPPR